MRCQRVRINILRLPPRGVVLKRSGGTPETTVRLRFLKNLGLHTRILIHVRKIATADLWSCPAIGLPYSYSCLSACSRSMHEFQTKNVGEWGTRPPCRKKWGRCPPRPRPTTPLLLPWRRVRYFAQCSSSNDYPLIITLTQLTYQWFFSQRIFTNKFCL